MGINTVALLFNDETSAFERSGPLGSLIARAMTSGWCMRDRDKFAPWFGPGCIISQAHADYSQVVVVGQNRGRPISEANDLDGNALAQCADALRRHGYTVKEPKQKRTPR